VSPELERLVGRAILDPTFRKQLFDDPDGTIKSAGFSLSEDEVKQVREAIRQRSLMGQSLDDKINEAAAGGTWS
jgi:hypothetical protein